ncbi:uncharacterized protein LOC131603986 [Vicia villosa]|uniref:uncharacterized protein LOC131603986 n=1 Tax=Vicia villosa TaxID=3911 RepID=UPI00273A89AA|nr:uncharacterized protein LOC131603986 [Vicia villosa]
MASSSNVLQPALKLQSTTRSGENEHIPNPNVEEVRAIYASQVIIPFELSGKTFAFMGPLPGEDNQTLSKFFPAYYKTRPLVSKANTNEEGCSPSGESANVEETSTVAPLALPKIRLNYMTNFVKVFRSLPLAKDPDLYFAWLEKVEKKKESDWKSLGIYDLIQLSKTGLTYNQPMLVAAVHFWDASHNTFHLPCGMVTPTLFDVAAITGLRPTGEDFDPTEMDDDTIGFNNSTVTYTAFIQRHHVTANEEVSDNEHIAFLALWLSRCAFCSRSIQVAKRYLCMANQLHNGKKLNLGQLLLGFLYENLSEAANLTKNFQSGTLLYAGPFWLLQLWLNATFEAHLPFRGKIKEEDDKIRNRTIEGTRLAYLTPQEEPRKLQECFLAYMMMFAQRRQFDPSMAPFVHRTKGPEWFTQKFPPTSQDQQTELMEIWESFLTPRLFLYRLRPSKGQCTLVCYQPNLVSRQFGLVQIKPKCLYEKRSHICFHTLYLSEEECEKKVNRYAGVTNLSPIPFESSFYCTPDFHQWWADYYTSQILDADSLTQELTAAFADVQEHFRKGTTTHIKEIQAFQKFFETIYRPDDLSRTVREAAITLREKFSAKLDKLKLPSYVRPELRYEVAFKLNPPKFPPLPSADFGVALSPPFPDWFVCGNVLKDLQNSSKKRAERVVPTKHTLDTFKGHLHIDLKHVRVLTPIPEGLDSDNLFD